jgi:WD40 repeat protein
MSLEKSQIITHITHSLPFTPFDVKWIPCSAKFVVVGQLPRGTGSLSVYQLTAQSIELISESEKPTAFKCGTFGASTLASRQFITGDFDGKLQAWDLERNLSVMSIKAHDQIINALDGCGGVGVNSGPPEVATASRDGCVKVWDIRQRDKAVVTISPSEGEKTRDAWTVAFGISFQDEAHE